MHDITCNRGSIHLACISVILVKPISEIASKVGFDKMLSSDANVVDDRYETMSVEEVRSASAFSTGCGSVL